MKPSRSFPLPDDLRSQMLMIAAGRWMRRTFSQELGPFAGACMPCQRDLDREAPTIKLIERNTVGWPPPVSFRTVTDQAASAISGSPIRGCSIGTFSAA